MGDANLRVDLFGDPIVERREGRGRPEHEWTLENSNKVLLAFVRGLSVKQAAVAIGVAVSTLRKHYSAEVAQRDKARLRFEMTQMHRLNEAAKGGNVTAERELVKMVDKASLAELAAKVAKHPKPPMPSPVGKKVQQQQAAQEVQGLYETPAMPGTVTH